MFRYVLTLRSGGSATLAVLLAVLIPATAVAEPPATTFAALARGESLNRGNRVVITLTPTGDVSFVEIKSRFLALQETSILLEAPPDYSWEETGIRTVSSDEFDAAVIAIPEERVYSIVKEPSSAGPAALIGAGAGFGIVAIPVLASCGSGCDEYTTSMALAMGGLMAGVGALAGWGIHGLATSPEEVYVHPAASRAHPLEVAFAPLLARDRKGVAFVIRW